ncbi:hypothetical protein [Plantactinospora mayteni]|uniref:hypothetical protein n=1 Tax=Plantactinospora mayteni TaxID=566021 RepID=UPI0019430A8C|nr:hypothetical protein [Plantactinospora mayteni]
MDGWPREHWERAAYAALRDGRDVLAGLPDDVSLTVLVEAVSLVLNQRRPDQPAQARAVAEAVQLPEPQRGPARQGR